MMNSSRRDLLSAILLTALATQAALAAPAPAKRGAGGVAAAVRAFYSYHFARKQCCFDEAGLKARREWLTRELYEMMLAEVRKEVPPDIVPYFDGDPFTNSQEGPTHFSVGKSGRRGSRATVSVTLRWTEGGRTVERRSLRIELLKAGGVWKIDNIVEPDGKTLRGPLKREYGN